MLAYQVMVVTAIIDVRLLLSYFRPPKPVEDTAAVDSAPAAA